MRPVRVDAGVDQFEQADDLLARRQGARVLLQGIVLFALPNGAGGFKGKSKSSHRRLTGTGAAGFAGKVVAIVSARSAQLCSVLNP